MADESEPTTPQAERPAMPTNFQWYSVCSRHIEFNSTCSACRAGEWINDDYHELEHWLYENDAELWKKWANLPKNKAFLESVFPGLRAVAPVETPNDLASFIALRLPEGLPLRGDRTEAKRVILDLIQKFGPATVETPRITAKKFWPKYYNEAPNFPPSEAACDFAEAYYAYKSKMA